MNTLYLDCFSGISGDMMVGALCDLGVKPSTFEWELSKLAIGDFHMHFERKQRQNVEGIKFSVHGGAVHIHEQDGEDHDHEHHHGHAHAHENGDGHEHHTHGHGPEVNGGDPGVPHLHSHGGHAHHEHPQAQSEAQAHVAIMQDQEHGDEVAGAQARHDEEHAHGNAGHVHDEEGDEDHEHVHGRTHRDIRALILESDLSPFVKEHSLSIFQRIAVAEGKIHGVAPADVGFHEVGALDSIADIILTCVGFEALGVRNIIVSPLHEGTGWVKCAHGRFPVPTMATLEILRGIPLAQTDEPHELITPTGAAIVAEFATTFAPMPRMRAEKIGYGVGSRDLKSRPNVLRAILGEVEQAAGDSGYLTDTVTRIETNIDDLPAEITGAIVDRLFAIGALDVFLMPIQMKKNRPGVLLTALCEESMVNRIADLLFAETSTFGLRMDRVKRLKLDRKHETVRTEYGEISVKLGLKDGEILQVAPEFESCKAAGDKSGKPLRAIYEAAIRAFHSRER